MFNKKLMAKLKKKLWRILSKSEFTSLCRPEAKMYRAWLKEYKDTKMKELNKKKKELSRLKREIKHQLVLRKQEETEEALKIIRSRIQKTK